MYIREFVESIAPYIHTIYEALAGMLNMIIFLFDEARMNKRTTIIILNIDNHYRCPFLNAF